MILFFFLFASDKLGSMKKIPINLVVWMATTSPFLKKKSACTPSENSLLLLLLLLMQSVGASHQKGFVYGDC